LDSGETRKDTFAELLGNAAALRSLERDLASGVSHAYLFYGPSGLGKRTVARRFGAALVAGGVSGDRRAEERARRGLHLDLHEVEPDGAFTTIGQIREVVRLASGRPFEGARRVFVLQADTLNVQAANALLKTLESPEAGAIFVLVAVSLEGVLPTVVSRARPVRFNPVPEAELYEFLSERGLPDGEARLATSLGRGSVGLSLRYGFDMELRDLRQAVVEAGLLFGSDFEARHQGASKIVERAEAVGEAREKVRLEKLEEPDRRAKDAAKRAGRAARDGAVREALELLALLYRDAAVISAGAPELAANNDLLEELTRLVQKHPEADWAGAALETGQAEAGLTFNVSSEAVLEEALSRARRRILRTKYRDAV
jgi:DNA polymerase III subunit delta'